MSVSREQHRPSPSKCRRNPKMSFMLKTGAHGQEWNEIQTNMRAIQKTWPGQNLVRCGQYRWQSQKPIHWSHTFTDFCCTLLQVIRIITCSFSSSPTFFSAHLPRAHSQHLLFGRIQTADLTAATGRGGCVEVNVKWSIGSSKRLFLCYPAAAKISQP